MKRECVCLIDSPAQFVGDFDALRVGFGSGADPEKGVGRGAVVVQVGNVERLVVQDGHRSRAQAVAQTLELGQLLRRRRIDAARKDQRAKVHLRVEPIKSRKEYNEKNC